MAEEIRRATRNIAAASLVFLGCATLAVGCSEAPKGTASDSGNAIAAANPVPILQPESLTIEPELREKKERENLSGSACAGNGTCLMIGDEMPYARFFTISGSKVVPSDGRLFLLPPTHPDGSDESDAEGVAFADGFFYVVGSHSRNKQGDAQASRHHLYRIAVDPQTQRPSDLGSASAPSSDSTRASLDNVIADHPLLKQHLMEPPGDTPDGAASHGVNVEGIAVAGGRMFIGFRGPVGGDGAVILETDANAMFGTAPVAATSHPVRLGPAMGVRDLASVQDGLLILSGPERRQVPPNAQIVLWKRGSKPVPLGSLPSQGQDNSAEAITVLAETDDAYRVLVLWDGKAGGLPMIVDVPKRRP